MNESHSEHYTTGDDEVYRNLIYFREEMLAKHIWDFGGWKVTTAHKQRLHGPWDRSQFQNRSLTGQDRS